MPDDPRHGGTRDPHEPGRRHRREDVPPPAPAHADAPDEQPRRRRRSVESGGVSVADLVQRHTGSRPDLTALTPEQLRQNGLMPGRRARQDEQPPPRRPQGRQIAALPPPQPIAAPPLDRGDGFPQDRPQQRGHQQPDAGFPRDEGVSKRPGGTSSYFTIPSDALRESVSSEQAGDNFVHDNGFPADGFQNTTALQADEPPVPPVRRQRRAPRPVGETSAPRNGFPPDEEAPRRGGGHRAAPPQGEGFPPDDTRRGRRVGEASGPRNGFLQDAFGPDRGPRRAGEASSHLPAPGGFVPEEAGGFPPDVNAGRNGRRGRRGPGERMPDGGAPRRRRPAPEMPGGRRAGAPEDGFPQEAPGRGRHVPEDPNGFPTEVAGRRPGEASAFFGGPGDDPNGFPPDTGRGGRRVGEASAHYPIPGEGSGPRRRVGEASTHFGPQEDGFPPDTRGRHAPEDPNGFPPDPGRSRQAPGRRVGEASAHYPVPGEGSGPRRRVGEASAHFGAPAEDGFPPEGRARPGDGPRDFPPVPGPRDMPGRPEGAARRRAGRAGAPQPEPARERFPIDSAPQPEPESDLFPVDDFRASEEPQETHLPQDAPAPKPRRASGVPAVPMMPPRPDDDPISMTTEMEAIGDDVQKRRTIDHTLARFSAVHDEIKAEEREKKAKRRKLRPWERDDEMDRLDELEAQQSMAMVVPNLDPRDEEDDEDDDPKKAKKKRRWRKGKYAGKAFSIFFAGLIFLSTATAWGIKTYIESGSQQVDALDPDSDSIQDRAAQLGDENFLLVGSDTRAGATAQDGVGDEKSVEGARSDTVMIAHVPKDRERVVVVSFPRDLEVNRPACEGWDPKTGSYTGEQHPEAKRVKLNTAYQTGGPMCVTKLVQNLSGLAINHFVGIDFHGFKDMVDAVQGVQVCVERPMKDDVLGMVVPEAGKNVKLTGDQALNFVRARHVEGDATSDYGRIIRQQRFLSSLLRKAMSTEVLLSPGKLTKFVDAFSKATFGDNIGVDQLFTLGQSMQGVEAGRVTFITVPTVGIENARHNEDLRVDDSNALFEAIRQDVPLPGEAPKKDDSRTQTQAQAKNGVVAPPPTLVDPKGVKIQVLNGGNETGGIAGDTGDQLADLGFDVVRVDAAQEPTDKTIIRYSKSREAQAQTLKAAVPGATLVEDASVAGALILVIGPDFDGTVQSPTTGGPPVDVPDNLSTVNAGDVSCA
ncbi:LCP family protein [Actinophytocola oryzae]|uniref:LytR family transcriptional attenuator n=1 Tax=Actinophytocola oryzae TaxID=502181 RepID=A0A4R7UTR8_9PSEU|nr:LCP family protein [Actinophytocola oryzae]TDV40053.1 LytR family transcriptional attenuator [Actinophytocola oryzae]